MTGPILPEVHFSRVVERAVREWFDVGKAAPVSGRPDRESPSSESLMLYALLLYGYYTGVRSSLKIWRLTYEDPTFRTLCRGFHPDPDMLSVFRASHRSELCMCLFQLLYIAREVSVSGLEGVRWERVRQRMAAERVASGGGVGPAIEVEWQTVAIMAHAEQEDAEAGDWVAAPPASEESGSMPIDEARSATDGTETIPRPDPLTEDIGRPAGIEAPPAADPGFDSADRRRLIPRLLRRVRSEWNLYRLTRRGGERDADPRRSGQGGMIRGSISIIIPTMFRDASKLALTLKSFGRHTRAPFETCLETGGTFAQNVNAGLRRARGEYLVITNDDVEVFEGWDVPYRERLSEAGVGMVAPFALGKRQTLREDWLRTRSGYPCASFWLVMISREAFEKVGYLDEQFLHSYEDEDFCIRLGKAGFKMVRVSETPAIHHHEGHQPYNDRVRRSRERFIRKWGSEW